MHLIFLLIMFIVFAAIIVWIADWTSDTSPHPTAVDVLKRRLARGEIDKAEYDAKLELLGTRRRR
jgi:uncharacterized membrane protein